MTPQDHQEFLVNLGFLLKKYYYNFYDYYYLYATIMEQDYHLLYANKNVTKLRGGWQETLYTSQLADEMEFIIYQLYKINILNNKDLKEMKSDLENYLFFRIEKKEKIKTYFIKLLYYFSANFESAYKDIFTEIEDEVYKSYKSYISILNNIYISLEILALILYLIFFIANNYFLFYSNEIIIKNVIFLFLDYNEDKSKYKNNNNINIVNLKLLEFKKINDDFDLNRFEIYSKNLDNINQNKTIDLSDKINYSDDKKNNNDKKSRKNLNFTKPKNTSSKNNIVYNDDNQNGKKKDKDNNYKQMNNSNYMNNIFDSKNKGTNNSSHNYLMESNSQFFRDKLNNNNSINASKELMANSINYSSSSNSKRNIKEKGKNLEKEENIEDNNNIKDIILNKSNKPNIFLIKIYMVLMILIIVIITIFSIYKIIYTISFNTKFNTFFSDFSVISNRYSILYNYFNVFRTILISPENKRKELLIDYMEKMKDYYEKQNTLFVNILSSNMDTYTEIINLFDLLTETKNNPVEKIKEIICTNHTACLAYLNSPKNIVGSGVDFAYKICINNIDNLYLNYKGLDDNKNITEIISTIINTQSLEFTNIGLSLNNMFFYVKEKIFDCFRTDVTNFNESFDYNISTLNIISIIVSILNFLFVIIIIFLTISNYSKPIKESSYRINCSFTFIRNYSLTN